MAGLRDLPGELGVGLGGAGLHQLDCDHRAATAHVTDDAGLVGDGLQARLHHGLNVPRGGDEVELLHRRDRAHGRRTCDGVSAVGAAEATDVDGVHDLGAAGDPSEGKPTGDSLGGRDEVRDDTLVVTGEPIAGATEAGLDLVGDEHDAVGA